MFHSNRFVCHVRVGQLLPSTIKNSLRIAVDFFFYLNHDDLEPIHTIYLYNNSTCMHIKNYIYYYCVTNHIKKVIFIFCF